MSTQWCAVKRVKKVNLIVCPCLLVEHVFLNFDHIWCAKNILGFLISPLVLLLNRICQFLKLIKAFVFENEQNLEMTPEKASVCSLFHSEKRHNFFSNGSMVHLTNLNFTIVIIQTMNKMTSMQPSAAATYKKGLLSPRDPCSWTPAEKTKKSVFSGTYSNESVASYQNVP